MMAVFDFLKQRGLSSSDQINNKIFSTNLSDLAKLNDDLVNLMPPNHLDSMPGSVFNFSPSSSLSGVAHCCNSLECRLRTIQQISTFAAMYSDRLIIPSFILKIPESSLPTTDNGLKAMQDDVSQNIHALFYYKPLIDAGIVVLTYDRSGFCNDCFNKQTKILTKKLKQLIGALVSYELFDKNTLVLKQAKKYTDLPIKVFRNNLKHIPKDTKYPYRFSSDEVEKYKLFEDFFSPIVQDILRHRGSVINSKTSYLTNRMADGEIIELAKYHNKTNTSTSLALLQGMKHVVPNIENADLKKVIELRLKDGEAFIIYRDSMRRLFNEVKSEDPKIIREAFNDIVAPEIVKIQRLIRLHREKFSRKLNRQVAFNSIALAVGVAASLAAKSPDLLLSSSSLIGLHSLADTTKTMHEGRDIPDEAKMNSYYFLWKVINKSKA